MQLPPELRAQIREQAIEEANRYYPHWKSLRDLDKEHGYRLASVSKEWQDDVERAFFRQVRVDPLDERDVATFKKHFTDKRRRFLRSLEIYLDDAEEPSPWHKDMGLLRISQLMEKFGQFYHHINSWDFCRDGKRQQPLEIIFETMHWFLGDEHPFVGITSLWDERKRDAVTSQGISYPYQHGVVGRQVRISTVSQHGNTSDVLSRLCALACYSEDDSSDAKLANMRL